MTSRPHSELQLNLREHGICFVLPFGAQMAGGALDLPGGALIHGRFSGTILCRSGSLIVSRSGDISGQVDADRVYIDGRVTPSPDGSVAMIKGRRLVAVSEMAQGAASLFSQAFAVHTSSFSASYTTLERS